MRLTYSRFLGSFCRSLVIFSLSFRADLSQKLINLHLHSPLRCIRLFGRLRYGRFCDRDTRLLLSLNLCRLLSILKSSQPSEYV